MKINALLNDLFRGEWLLDVNWISSAAPLVENIIKGMPIVQENTEAVSIISAVTEKGSPVKIDQNIPENSVAIVNMVGAMMKYDGLCSYGAESVIAALNFANNNSKFSAIIFNIDGPGGSVSAIGPFLQFAKNKKKPVVVLADAALSLHYWTAVAVSDHIMADNDISARFGSVGVVSTFVDAKQHWEEKGYKFHEIYPPESKDKNAVFNLALKGKYDKIRSEILSPMARKFQNGIKEGRPNLKEAPGVLTGATFSAEESLSLGMIDSIGDLGQAIEMALIHAEINNKYKSFH